MAELIAIAGGIAAIVQLAGTGRRLCKILHQFATDAGAAGVEVRRFANQVRTFSDSIELAERTLFIYCRDHRTSRLVADMEERNILANIDYEAETVRAHLRAIRDRVLNMKSRSVLWATIKWRFNKASILELSPEMESVKTNLNLIIATTQFEALTTVVDAGIASNSEEPNGELQTQMRKLRRVIKNHLGTMQDLRAHLRHTRPVEREASVGSLDLELEEEDPLTELGWRIYKRASIPNSPQPSSSSSFQDYPNQPREPRSTSPKPPGFNMPHPVRSEISSRQTSPEPPDPPPDTGPALSSESFSEPPSFKKTSRHKQGHGVKSTNGYVQNPSGDMRWHQTTASLVEFLPGNIISIRKAKELDLEIETLTLPEDATLDFGTGAPEKISGKTTFKWKAWDYIKPPYPPLTITCDVCENSTVGLILGKPFLEERKRCWSREEARSS